MFLLNFLGNGLSDVLLNRLLATLCG